MPCWLASFISQQSLKSDTPPDTQHVRKQPCPRNLCAAYPIRLCGHYGHVSSSSYAIHVSSSSHDTRLPILSGSVGVMDMYPAPHMTCILLLICLSYQALWALWTLAAHSRYVQRIVSSGATGSIITAMSNHPLEAGVQEQALWCLYHLTAKHPANRSRIVSLGGCNLLDLAASNHPTVKSITEFVPTIRLCLSDTVTIYSSSTSASNPPRGSPSENPLPAGWTQHFDEKTGLPYYHAASTALTVWERPTEPAPPTPRSDAAVYTYVCMYVLTPCD